MNMLRSTRAAHCFQDQGGRQPLRQYVHFIALGKVKFGFIWADLRGYSAILAAREPIRRSVLFINPKQTANDHRRHRSAPSGRCIPGYPRRTDRRRRKTTDAGHYAKQQGAQVIPAVARQLCRRSSSNHSHLGVRKDGHHPDNYTLENSHFRRTWLLAGLGLKTPTILRTCSLCSSASSRKAARVFREIPTIEEGREPSKVR
jgi:hypothetical protein